ncbi:dicarboxylate carrier UCP2 [Balearica regulorum gibbericeps]|uniref:dicarboxylate carrier UCP2 n=1 Tax=Balearica regulorum gibbericeps TaxID=100784 RepID=UPI003F625FB5
MVGFKPPEVPPTAAVKFLGADVVTFPLDTAKARAGRGPRSRKSFGTIATTVRTEGPRSPYSGLAAGLQQQTSFASIRVGLYDSVKQFYAKGRLMAGCPTGTTAVAFAQPTEVVKVRFQAGREGGRRYQGTIDAYGTSARQEGGRGLGRGTSPNIARSAIVNCVELVTYDLIKDALLKSHLASGEAPGSAAETQLGPCNFHPEHPPGEGPLG